MKVLLYFEKQNAIKQSGIGRALSHQKQALELNNIEYTLNPKESYDVAHINTLFTDSYKLLKKCKKKNIPVIVHGHSTIEDFRYSFRLWRCIAPFFNRMILRMYRNADYIITPTAYSKQLIENYKGVNCPVYAISNGIRLEDYEYNEEKVKKFDEYFKIKDEKIVICAGLYFERKGITDFFEIARKMPDVKFIWFGHLKRCLTPLKILKAIRKRPKNVIMPGYVDIDILRGAFHKADAFLFLSHEENEGIAVLEAIASKLPVIVRDIPVFSWLEDKEHVLKGKTILDFVDALENVLNHNQSDMILNAYHTLEERTLKKVGTQMLEIYNQVYEDKKSSQKM